MINKIGVLSKTKVNIVKTRYKIDHNNLVKILKFICKKVLIGKELFTLIKKAQIRDNL